MSLADLIREKKSGVLAKLEACGESIAKLYSLLCEFDNTGLSFRIIGCASADPNECHEVWLTAQGESLTQIEDLKSLVAIIPEWVRVEDAASEAELYMKTGTPITLGFDCEEGRPPTVTMIYAYPSPDTPFKNSEYRGSANVLMDEMAEFLDRAG